MESFVYVIGSADGTRHLTYVGWTLDVAAGGPAQCRHRRALDPPAGCCFHVERFATRREAMSRECTSSATAASAIRCDKPLGG